MPVCEDRGMEAIAELAKVLGEKGGDPNAMTKVAIDMSPTYISGVQTNLPNAQIIFDKFHIATKLREAINEVRKLESRGNQLLKGHKYTVLKNSNKLGDSKQNDLDFLLIMYPRLGEAYRLKTMSNDFWYIKDEMEANTYLTF